MNTLTVPQRKVIRDSWNFNQEILPSIMTGFQLFACWIVDVKVRILLFQLYLTKKTRAERKFIKEEKCRNAFSFHFFLRREIFFLPSI